MKKILVLLMLTVSSMISFKSSAQINLNVNIGSQPLWGPVGYDHVEYYYMPDIESYYYVPTREFIYQSNGRWVFSSNRPARFSNYDFYNGYKVVINSPKPYLNFNQQKVKYAKFKSNRSQIAISRSSDPKYYVVKGHPKHAGKKVMISNSPGKSKAHYNKGNGHGNSKGNKGKGKG